MKVTTWVDFSKEVEVGISAEDIRCALTEAFEAAKPDPQDERTPAIHTILRALNSMATFLNGLTDEHIARMKPGQRKLTREFLLKNADRFLEAASPAESRDHDSLQAVKRAPGSE
jgi:hypothetical protein